jgi:hypothetical protein
VSLEWMRGVHWKGAHVSTSTWTGMYWKVDGEHSWRDVYIEYCRSTKSVN